MADMKMLTTPRPGPDLYDRDYKGVNTHLMVTFEDIIAEPDTIHTYDCVWLNSYKCYDVCHTFTYGFATICCGLCSVLVGASEVASAFFFYIWCGAPCLKAMELHCFRPRRLCQTFVDCFVIPCCVLASKHLGSSTSSSVGTKQCNGALPVKKDLAV